MKRLLLAAALWMCAAQSPAGLIDRGSGLIYDDVLDITWMQNANFIGFNASWNVITNEAANVTFPLFAGFDDWRLPTVTLPDPGCEATPNLGIGFGCTLSEMGHMFYVNFGGTDGQDLTGNQGPFINIQRFYWTDTTSAVGNQLANIFDFGSGLSNISLKSNQRYGWLVRDGDVITVAEPGTLALAALGLTGLLFRRRKNGTVPNPA